MTKTFKSLSRGCAALALWAVLSSTASAVQMVVIESDDDALPAGHVFDGATEISVAAEKRVVVIDETGKTVALAGPYTGAPGAGADPASTDPSMIAALADLATAAGPSKGSLGATRTVDGIGGIKPQQPALAVDVGSAGTYCVPAAGPVVLWRASSRGGGEAKVKKVGESMRAEVAWGLGMKETTWPAAVGLEDGAGYVILSRRGSTATRVTLKLIPAELEQDAPRAIWMAKNDCMRQAKLLLGEIAAAAE
ncbi:MAG: hypothetical protein ACPGO3_02475 [Magnetospiraceae bacterium]